MHLVLVTIKPANPLERQRAYQVNAAYHKPFHMSKAHAVKKDERLNVASGEDVCLNEEETRVFS